MPPHGGAVPVNERRKRRYRALLGAGLAASALIHALAALLSPAALIERYLRPSREVRLLALPEPPSASEPVERPPRVRSPYGAPTPAGGAVDEAPRPPPPLDAPPIADGPRTIEELLDGPTETPHDIAPQLRNLDDVIERLRAFYPPARWVLGVTARLQLWCLIDGDGAIRRVLIHESSGYDDIDEAVLRAAAFMKFTPALSGGRGVPVWVSLPITFQPEPLGRG